MNKTKSVMVRVVLHGVIQVTKETYDELKSNTYIDVQDVTLPWDEICNLDGEIEADV